MKTYTPKKDDVQKKWYIIDATDKAPGRIATKIANKLRGKDKSVFTPHLDCGDFVIVINAEKVKFSGNKEESKLYHRHSGYPGGYKNSSVAEMLAKHPTKIVELTVRGMLPHNKLKKVFMSKLKVYAGAEHPHEAQKPETLEV